MGEMKKGERKKTRNGRNEKIEKTRNGRNLKKEERRKTRNGESWLCLQLLVAEFVHHFIMCLSPCERCWEIRIKKLPPEYNLALTKSSMPSKLSLFWGQNFIGTLER